jgi:hypothetical protein
MDTRWKEGRKEGRRKEEGRQEGRKEIFTDPQFLKSLQ